MSVATKRKRRPGSTIASEKGVALITVLWTLVVIMVMALSLSALTRNEGSSLLFFKQKEERRLLAEAGIERGVVDAVHFCKYRNQQLLVEGNEVVKVDGTRYKGTLTTGTYEYALQDESGKINLNTLTDASGVVLNNLLVNHGVEKERADGIVDSILDWKDQDELVRLHGAESEYYKSLPSPRKSKNAAFDAVEEILLVKGVTREMIYGTGEKPGILHLLTVYSGGGGINLNAASREVLAALPGMTPELVEAVIQAREQTPQGAGVSDTVRAALGAEYSVIAPFVGAAASNVYSIEATGYSKTGGPGFTVRAVIAVQTDGRYKYMHYKSSADAAKPLESQAQKDHEK